MVTGGFGYKGSVLVPKLLEAGHDVTVVDTGWFGRHVGADPRLEFVQQDIREPVDCKGFAAIIHLAGIANDPCGELDSKLTWEVNVLATQRLVEAAVKAGVEQFIFASSASVYGIQDNKPVTEDSPMAPVSDYNKTKQVAERVLASYSRDIEVKIVRPATVCGVSPRMRLDVVVNMLTAQALQHGKITAHCGAHGATLMRPHVHIEDITDLYVWLLDKDNDDLWNATGSVPENGDCHIVFNAGFDNMAIGDTAKLINDVVASELTVSQVADKRSYCVDSTRLLSAGFKPRLGVRAAIDDIVIAAGEGRIKLSDPRSINLSWMRSQGLVRE